MPHEWMIRILEALALYAHTHDLPRLAAHLREARDLALVEIGQNTGDDV